MPHGKRAWVLMHINIKIAIYAVAIAGVLLYGTVGSYLLGRQQGNFNVQIVDPVQALYFAVVTIATVGYGDIVPVTDAARVFTIILILSGLSIFLSAVTVLSSDFLSDRVEHLYSGIGRVDRRKMNGHIVLIGYDATNAILAERLRARRRNFVIITADKPLANDLKDRGYPAYVADYTLSADMERFNLGAASHIIIDLRDSSKAVYVVLVARKLAKDARISVVAPNAEAEAHLADLNVENVINPQTIAADLLTKAIERDVMSESRAKRT